LPCRLDPAKYQLPPLDEGAAGVAGGGRDRRSSPSVFRFDAPPRRPSSRRQDGAEPSPIYAEPYDRLAAGQRQRVALRRGPGPVTPPISASYKLPRDFLRFTAENTSDVQLSASFPDGKNAVRSPQAMVAAPPSTLDDDAGTLTDEPVPVPGGPRARGDDRSRLRAAAAVVRRQRRSNYDNDDDDEDSRQSRCPTACSARTEYSPPWDTDRWRLLVNTAERQLILCGDGVINSQQFCHCDAQRTGTLEQHEQVGQIWQSSEIFVAA